MAKKKKEEDVTVDAAAIKEKTVTKAKEEKVSETPKENKPAKDTKTPEPVKPVVTDGDFRAKLKGLIDLDFVNKYRADDKTVVEIAGLVADAAIKSLSLSGTSERKIATKLALQVLRK